MNCNEITNVFNLRTLYGIPIRVVTDAPNDYIAVSPEVMRQIQDRGSELPRVGNIERRIAKMMH
jgi:hypothetical protein